MAKLRCFVIWHMDKIRDSSFYVCIIQKMGKMKIIRLTAKNGSKQLSRYVNEDKLTKGNLGIIAQQEAANTINL